MVPVNTARHFWSQFADEVRAAAEAAGRTVYITAESSANDPRTVRPTSRGGFGNDAQWNDDFHNALHVALTGESAEYYKDFTGVRDFATALREVRTALRRYRSATDAVAAFDQQVVGTLAENLKLARETLAAGKLGLLEVNVVRRDLVESQLAYLDSIAEAVEARAALETAIGHSLEGTP